MFTKEALLTASNFSKNFKGPYPYRGVLTTEEAVDYINQFKSLVTITNVRTDQYFFTEDHCFGVNVLPDEWVPCTARIPQVVSKRPELSDGIIDDLEKYCKVFFRYHQQISSIDELVSILNSNK